MTEGTVQTIETTARPETVLKVAADLEQYPDWAAGVKEVEVLETDERGRPLRARFVIEAMIKELSYVLVYDWSNAPERMVWEAEPNKDIEELAGSYQFEQLEDGGTSIVYMLRVQTGFKVPGFLRKQAEKQLIGAALRGLRGRAEAMGAG